MKVKEINEFSDEALNQIVEVIRPIIYSKDKEIERLKEELTILVKDDERNQETIINLGKENEELYERVKGLEVASSKLDYESTIYANRIDKAIEYIENDMPYLEEPDEEFERCDGTIYMTMKEYDTSVLLNILKGEDKC